MSLTSPDHSSPSGEEFSHIVARVNELSQDVETLKAQFAARDAGPPYEEVRAAIDQVRAMTIEVFGNVGEIEETCDIEDESWRIIVVHVDDSGEVEDIVKRAKTWNSRLSEAPREVRTLFRLSLGVGD